MSLVSITPKKYVKIYQDAFERLESLITNLLSKEPEEEYIYELDSRHSADGGPAMLAVAIIGDSHAVYAPKYLTEEQLVIFEHFLREADSNDHLIVFSQRDYEAVKKYLRGKEVDVKKFF